MWNWKKLGLFIGATALLGAVFFVGLYTGLRLPAENKISKVLSQNPPAPLPDEVDFAAFWQAWSIAEQKFVDIDKIERQDMVYGAISGLLKSMDDPYTVFFTPEDNKAFQEEIKGEFQGVGMEVGIRKEILTVIAPLKGSPAERAGIRAGDKILKIDDKSSADLTLEEAVRTIRGEKGTKVKLVIIRNGEDDSRTFEIERAVINIPVLDTDNNASSKISKENGKPVEETDAEKNGIFVIKLYNFSETSPLKFREALRQFILSGNKKLILDLRNNPGGYLEAAVDIASWFLPQGDIVVTEDFGKGEKTDHRSRGYNIFKDLPMVVLVNEGSASASEILAGALSDHGKARLIGQKTFGKGSVQELLPLTADTSLKITIAKWLTPNGTSISEKGLEPDINVEFKKEDIDAGKDPVMEKAIEVLKSR